MSHSSGRSALFSLTPERILIFDAYTEIATTSDVDVCLVLQPVTYSPETLMDIRLQYLTAFAADIQIFQQHPIYLRQRVPKEGQVLCCKDEDVLYDIALRTVQAFADFKPLAVCARSSHNY